MNTHENTNTTPEQSESLGVDASDLQAQLEAIPAEYPPLPDDVVTEITVLHGKNGQDRLPRGTAEILQRNWMIEQRLSAINDAREDGTISPEVANALELDALRKMRDNIHFEGTAVPIDTAHRMMESHGLPPLNVSRPGRVPLSRNGVVKLEF